MKRRNGRKDMRNENEEESEKEEEVPWQPSPKSILLTNLGSSLPSCLTKVEDFDKMAPALDSAIFKSASTDPVLGPDALKIQQSNSIQPPIVVFNIFRSRLFLVMFKFYILSLLSPINCEFKRESKDRSPKNEASLVLELAVWMCASTSFIFVEDKLRIPNWRNHFSIFTLIFWIYMWYCSISRGIEELRQTSEVEIIVSI